MGGAGNSFGAFGRFVDGNAVDVADLVAGDGAFVTVLGPIGLGGALFEVTGDGDVDAFVGTNDGLGVAGFAGDFGDGAVAFGDGLGGADFDFGDGDEGGGDAGFELGAVENEGHRSNLRDE